MQHQKAIPGVSASVLLGGVLSCTHHELHRQAQAWGKSY